MIPLKNTFWVNWISKWPEPVSKGPFPCIRFRRICCLSSFWRWRSSICPVWFGGYFRQRGPSTQPYDLGCDRGCPWPGVQPVLWANRWPFCSWQGGSERNRGFCRYPRERSCIYAWWYSFHFNQRRRIYLASTYVRNGSGSSSSPSGFWSGGSKCLYHAHTKWHSRPFGLNGNPWNQHSGECNKKWYFKKRFNPTNWSIKWIPFLQKS